MSEINAEPLPVVHLRRGGTSVVVDLGAVPNPVILHWGADLGDLDQQSLDSLAVAARSQRVSGGLDTSARFGLLATPAGGWLGSPTLEGHRSGADFSAKLTATGVEVDEDALVIDLTDAEIQLSVHAELRIGVSGVFRQRLTLRNDGEADYTLQTLQLGFPLPWEATEILDTTGRHLRERSAQRHALTFGSHVRESRRGRPAPMRR